MNNEKLTKYSLTASIHTLSIKSPGVVEDIDPEVSGCIAARTRHKKDGVVTTNSTINPNKLYGDCFKSSDFQASLKKILAGAGISNYQLMRADLRLDNYDPEHYKAFSKLNRYLISMLAVTYKVKNTYRTTDLFTSDQLSVAIKNDYFEIENYDRAAKSEQTDHHEPAKARLEERTMRKEWAQKYSYGDFYGLSNMDILIDEFTHGWFERWNKAIQNVDKVHTAYNDALAKIYLDGKSAYPKKFRSLTDFLIQYQECIFCKKQLIDLLTRFPEVKDPKQRAETHKKRYGIEYFSKADIQKAVEEIKRATLEFFYS